MPCSTVSVRIAWAILALITETIPSASSGTPSPSSSPSAATASRAAPVSSDIRPPAKVLGVDAAEHEVGVGHGRAGAAAAVAGRARIGAGALGPDAQPAGLGVGDRAAAGADRVDVRDRHQQREALERGLGRDVGLAGDHEAHVEARPAHVDADQVRAAERAGERDEAHRAADRAREQRLQRPLARRLRGDDAAARLHHVQRDREPLSLHLRLEPLEVAADHGRGVGLDDGGRGPLVLAPLARDAMRERDRHPVELLAHDLLDAQLVLRVEEAEEERDGDRAEALVARSCGGGTNGRLVERHALLAAPVEPARDLDDVAQSGTSGVGLR